MAKRTKTVFSSNKQLTHVWANQSQAEGRANSMFFDGTEIFSYGRHYTAAKIHIVKGKSFALVNNYNYSVTTAKHLGYVRGALSGLMPYFSVSDVYDVKKSVRELDQVALNSVCYALKRLKVPNKDSIKGELERIQDAFKNANDFRQLVGLKPKKPNKNDIAKVRKHFEARLKRSNELNTPEMKAKKEAIRLQKAALENQKQIVLQAESIEKFKKGENVSVNGIPFEILRIKGNEVQTSRGAVVPVVDAAKLYQAIQLKQNVVGFKCGSFTVESVYPYFQPGMPEDWEVKIGCHRILLSEASRILESMM